MHQIQIENVLRDHGLICQTFVFNDLPHKLQSSITNACDVHFKNSYLSLIANVGSEFWSAMQTHTSQLSVEQQEQANQNPVDEFSISILNKLLRKAGLENDSDILYPAHYRVPLIALGEHAGWSTPSPLGLGLHPTFGPWFAYRALAKTKQPLLQPENPADAQGDLSSQQSACLNCVSTPCVKACPASAVSSSENFNINRCADYRIQDDSNCTQQCHARNACPVGSQYRYSEQQRAYHMTRALDALVSWSSQSKP